MSDKRNIDIVNSIQAIDESQHASPDFHRSLEPLFYLYACEIADSLYMRAVVSLNQSCEMFTKADYTSELYLHLCKRQKVFIKLFEAYDAGTIQSRMQRSAYGLAKGSLMKHLFETYMVYFKSLESNDSPESECHEYDESDVLHFAMKPVETTALHYCFSDGSPDTDDDNIAAHIQVECVRGILTRRQFELLSALVEGESLRSFADIVNYSTKSAQNLSYVLQAKLSSILADETRTDYLRSLFTDSLALHAA